MSRRTAESNKAIATAWEKEQQRVSEGKGTRDWTPKQQQDILEFGKAYDDNGKAFEGQHMRSAEMYPEYQGDPANIQFLTREEHLAAHCGDWRNPTNGYFDPVTRVMTDFGDGPMVPCKEIKLSESIIKIEISNEPVIEDEINSVQPEEKKCTGADSPDIDRIPKAETVAEHAVPVQTGGKIGIGRAIWHGLVRGAKAVGHFCIEHPIIIELGLGLAAIGVKTVVNPSSGNSDGGSSHDNSYHSSLNSSDDSDYDISPVSDGSETEDINYPETHASPYEHTVSGHCQHYHTKDGEILKEKAPYKRGSNHSDE